MEACRRLAGQSDVVVVVVAHRYGWVPSVDEGGDGERSITRIEFDTAVDPGVNVPLLAFLVDDRSVWTEVTEDRDTGSLRGTQSVVQSLCGLGLVGVDEL